MEPAYDVLIVGGGPAGLSTALFLVHERPELAERVVVLEKEHYPRDKFCAGGLGARADLLLASAGARLNVPSAPLGGVSLRVAEGEIAVRQPEMGRVVRRLEFDHALAATVRARGVRVVEGARATALSIMADGVSVESTAGRFRGAVVVGADGVGSFVRRALGLPRGRLRAQVLELDTEPTCHDPPRDLLHFDASDPKLTGYAWDFPTVVDGRELVCRGIYRLVLDDEPFDVRASLAARLAARGLELERYRLKHFAERGFDLSSPFAQDRALLVGEAAGIDPLTGEGIPQALEYGAFAGRYLAEKIGGGDLAFRDYVHRLRHTRFGFDLAVRARLTRYYFGRDRRAFEAFLLGTPEFVSASLELFAGRRVSRVKLARSLFSAVGYAFGARFRPRRGAKG